MTITYCGGTCYLLSTDTKPTTWPNGATVPTNALCFEMDTGKTYKWNGTSWPLLHVGLAVTNSWRAALTTVDASPVTMLTPGADGTFLIGGQLNVTALGATGTIELTISWTDNNGNARSINSGLQSATGQFQIAPVVARVKSGTNITVQLTQGTGSTFTADSLAEVVQLA